MALNFFSWFPQKRFRVSDHGFLSTAGSSIVDTHGCPFVLRGMSLFWSHWQPQFYNQSTLQWLRDDWRVNVVRAPLAVAPDGFPDNPRIEQEKIECVIQAAIALDIYVIVDWHAHDPEPKRAVEFFTSIAKKYGHHPNLIYELWNEPADRYDWASIKQYHAIVAAAVRAIDQHNLIVAGTQNWCRDVDVAAEDPLPLQNVVYALHFYAGSHGQALRNKAERALRSGVPLLVTEWGTCRENGDGALDKREVMRWLRFLRANQIGHLNWAISDKQETAAALRPGSPESSWTSADLSPSGQLVRSQLRAG